MLTNLTDFDAQKLIAMLAAYGWELTAIAEGIVLLHPEDGDQRAHGEMAEAMADRIRDLKDELRAASYDSVAFEPSERMLLAIGRAFWHFGDPRCLADWEPPGQRSVRVAPDALLVLGTAL